MKEYLKFWFVILIGLLLPLTVSSLFSPAVDARVRPDNRNPVEVIPPASLDEGEFTKPVSQFNPDYNWTQQIWVNRSPVSNTNAITVSSNDVITLTNQIIFTSTSNVTFTLTNNWDPELAYQSYAIGNIPSGASSSALPDPVQRTLTWELKNGDGNWTYYLTQTVSVEDGDWLSTMLTESLTISGEATQPNPLTLSFQRLITETNVYLPILLKTYPAPTPTPTPTATSQASAPTISNLSSQLTSSSDCIGSNTHRYTLTFDYSDLNGNVTDPVSGDVHVIYAPHPGETEDVTFAELTTQLGGDGFSGTISLADFCLEFKSGISSRTNANVIVKMQDNTGLESNSLQIDIRRP